MTKMKADQEEKMLHLQARVKAEEDDRLMKLKIEEEEKIAAIKVKEAQQLADEEERIAKMKAEEEEKISQMKADEEAQNAQGPGKCNDGPDESRSRAKENGRRNQEES